MTEQQKAAVKLAFDACLFFGAALSTAHEVAALMARDFESWQPKP